jgi:starch synthase
MHICHNLDVTYEGRVYPKPDEGALEWLVQLPLEWYFERKGNKAIINPSKCAL